MTPPPEKPPLSLEQLLAESTRWFDPTLSGTLEEMATRLRAVAALHVPGRFDGCKECGGVGDCSTQRALDGERTDGH